MKNPLDPRHKKRQKTVEDLFKFGFHKQPSLRIRNPTDYQAIIRSISIIQNSEGKSCPYQEKTGGGTLIST